MCKTEDCEELRNFWRHGISQREQRDTAQLEALRTTIIDHRMHPKNNFDAFGNVSSEKSHRIWLQHTTDSHPHHVTLTFHSKSKVSRASGRSSSRGQSYDPKTTYGRADFQTSLLPRIVGSTPKDPKKVSETIERFKFTGGILFFPEHRAQDL